jgi:hypothetical protein
MKFIAKIFWPDCLETITEASFEALGLALGKHFEENFRMDPVKVEFSVEISPC